MLASFVSPQELRSPLEPLGVFWEDRSEIQAFMGWGRGVQMPSAPPWYSSLLWSLQTWLLQNLESSTEGSGWIGKASAWSLPGSRVTVPWGHFLYRGTTRLPGLPSPCLPEYRPLCCF